MDARTPSPQVAPADIVVRGRCACGRRFRVRNAQPGIVVSCPGCARPIPISLIDIRAATHGALLIPLQTDVVEAREALLIDHGRLSLAAEGSAIGPTGRVIRNHEESVLADAMRGWVPRDTAGPTSQRVGDITPRLPRLFDAPARSARRKFPADVWMSFAFAGCPKNGLNLLLTAVACSVPSVLMQLAWGPIAIAFLPFLLLALAYVAWFYWQVLFGTATGEDEIPWIASDFSDWRELLWPAIANVLVYALCAVPFLIARAITPPGPAYLGVLTTAALVGSLLLPATLLAVALEGPFVLARADLIVRSIVRIGPVYAIPWAAAVLTITAAVGLDLVTDALIERVAGGSSAGALAVAAVSFAQFALSIYLGYVLHRIVGLIYRHHHRRLLWER